jgi:uncharacterized protein YvpB
MFRRPAIALLVTMLSVLVAPWLAQPSTASAEAISVHSWIGVSSLTPGVGCAVDLSVELRGGGQGVASAPVEVALHKDGNLVSADRSVTGSNGVAFLTLDSSGAAAGVSYWIDVNVGGSYFTGFAIVPGSSSGCNAYTVLEASGDVDFVPAAPEASTSGSLIEGSHTKVWVPRYAQQRNLSCEYAAMYIATSAFGEGISEYSFDNVVGWSPNPHLGYRGNIHGTWGRTDDYGVYAEPLSWALDTFGFRGESFYGAGSSAQLTAFLDQGKPVVVWLALWGDDGNIHETLNGRTYQVTAGMHVMVAYGYDASGIYLSDPGSGTYRFYEWGYFMWMWGIMDGMGLAVSPY